MGRSIQITKDGKFRFWSSIVDEFVTKPLSRNKAIKCILEDKLLNLKLKVIEEFFCFPGTWVRKGSMSYIQTKPEDREAYGTWFEKASRGDFEKLVDEKFAEILKTIKHNGNMIQ